MLQDDIQLYRNIYVEAKRPNIDANENNIAYAEQDENTSIARGESVCAHHHNSLWDELTRSQQSIDGLHNSQAELWCMLSNNTPHNQDPKCSRVISAQEIGDVDHRKARFIDQVDLSVEQCKPFVEL